MLVVNLAYKPSAILKEDIGQIVCILRNEVARAIGEADPKNAISPTAVTINYNETDRCKQDISIVVRTTYTEERCKKLDETAKAISEMMAHVVPGVLNSVYLRLIHASYHESICK